MELNISFKGDSVIFTDNNNQDNYFMIDPELGVNPNGKCLFSTITNEVNNYRNHSSFRGVTINFEQGRNEVYFLIQLGCEPEPIRVTVGTLDGDESNESDVSVANQVLQDYLSKK